MMRNENDSVRESRTVMKIPRFGGTESRAAFRQNKWLELTLSLESEKLLAYPSNEELKSLEYLYDNPLSRELSCHGPHKTYVHDIWCTPRRMMCTRCI